MDKRIVFPIITAGALYTADALAEEKPDAKQSDDTNQMLVDSMDGCNINTEEINKKIDKLIKEGEYDEAEKLNKFLSELVVNNKTEEIRIACEQLVFGGIQDCLKTTDLSDEETASTQQKTVKGFKTGQDSSALNLLLEKLRKVDGEIEDIKPSTDLFDILAEKTQDAFIKIACSNKHYGDKYSDMQTRKLFNDFIDGMRTSLLAGKENLIAREVSRTFQDAAESYGNLPYLLKEDNHGMLTAESFYKILLESGADLEEAKAILKSMENNSEFNKFMSQLRTKLIKYNKDLESHKKSVQNKRSSYDAAISCVGKQMKVISEKSEEIKKNAVQNVFKKPQHRGNGKKGKK